jgi:hypothetical protein
VGEHIVTEHKIRVPVLPHDLSRNLCGEKCRQGRDAALGRGFRDVQGWLNAETRDSEPDKILEHVSIVAGNLHNETTAAQ